MKTLPLLNGSPYYLVPKTNGIRVGLLPPQIHVIGAIRNKDERKLGICLQCLHIGVKEQKYFLLFVCLL